MRASWIRFPFSIGGKWQRGRWQPIQAAELEIKVDRSPIAPAGLPAGVVALQSKAAQTSSGFVSIRVELKTESSKNTSSRVCDATWSERPLSRSHRP